MHREIERLEPREALPYHAAATRTYHAELAQHLAEVDQLEGLEGFLVLAALLLTVEARRQPGGRAHRHPPEQPPQQRHQPARLAAL